MTTEIVKVVAPIALKALAAAAEALIAGAVYAEKRTSLKKSTAGDDPVTTIQQDTGTYITTNFASTFGYYYEGLRSQPVSGALPVAANQDLLTWDPGEKGVSDIQTYLQNVFKGSIGVQDSIDISQNLAALFQDRFQEESLEWTPFTKRYNQPDKLIVDTYFVTASATDQGGNRAGLASYCFVAYNLA